MASKKVQQGMGCKFRQTIGGHVFEDSDNGVVQKRFHGAEKSLKANDSHQRDRSPIVQKRNTAKTTSDVDMDLVMITVSPVMTAPSQVETSNKVKSSSDCAKEDSDNDVDQRFHGTEKPSTSNDSQCDHSPVVQKHKTAKTVEVLFTVPPGMIPPSQVETSNKVKSPSDHALEDSDNDVDQERFHDAERPPEPNDSHQHENSPVVQVCTDLEVITALAAIEPQSQLEACNEDNSSSESCSLKNEDSESEPKELCVDRFDHSDIKSFSTYKELKDEIAQYEIETITQYCIAKESKGFNKDFTLKEYAALNSENLIIRWEMCRKDDRLPIQFNCIPFIWLGKRTYSCHQGKDQNVKKKERYKEKIAGKMMQGHTHKLRRNTTNKKRDCPVDFLVKKIVSFPTFKISKDTNRRRREVAKKVKEYVLSLKETTCDSEDITHFEVSSRENQKCSKTADLHRFHYLFRYPSDVHQNHHSGNAAGLSESLDDRISQYIWHLVENGNRSVKDLQFKAAEFVHEKIFGGERHPDMIRKRFCPDNRKIQNIIRSVRLSQRCRASDEENLSILTNRPKNIVDDLLMKMEGVNEKMIQSVRKISDYIYKVGSESTDSEYQLSFGDESHSCECECSDFKRNRLLCKHFFAVIKKGYQTFDDISPLFLKEPVSTLGNSCSSIDMDGENDLPEAEEIQHDGHLEGQSYDIDISTGSVIFMPQCFTEFPQRDSDTKFLKDNLISKVKQLTDICHTFNDQEMILELTSDIDTLLAKFSSHLHLDEERFGQKEEMMMQFQRAKLDLEGDVNLLPGSSEIAHEIVIGYNMSENTSRECTADPSDIKKDTLIVKDVEGLAKHPKRCSLTQSIKRQLVSNKKLKNDTINLAQAILHEQFPNLRGFEYISDIIKFPKMQENFVQLLHTGSDHWVTVSTENKGEIDYYDSNFSASIEKQGLPSHIVKHLTAISFCETPTLRIRSASVQQQDNDIDCGLFAIAYATDICYSIDPQNESYDVMSMRNHLLKCFEAKKLAPFPSGIKGIERCHSMMTDIDIYCRCRSAFFEEDLDIDKGLFMALCFVCNEWFHRKCENIDIKVFKCDEEAKRWRCSDCLNK